MDKKKVERLVISARNRLIDVVLSKHKQEELTKINEWLNEALDELQKSDWISVEDELPKYGEEVWVTSKEFPISVWKCRRVEGFIVPKDRHDFIILWEGRTTPITHWRKIDKLEV